MYVENSKNSSIENYISSQQCTTSLRAVIKSTIDVFPSKDAAGPLAPVTDQLGRQQWTALIRHCVLGHRNESRIPPYTVRMPKNAESSNIKKSRIAYGGGWYVLDIFDDDNECRDIHRTNN